MNLDANAVIVILTGVAGVVGGFFGGRRNGRHSEINTALNTVQLLRESVIELSRQVGDKESEILDLKVRIEVLESMVTQRADVEGVKLEVKGVRSVVDRIATKVGV